MKNSSRSVTKYLKHFYLLLFVFMYGCSNDVDFYPEHFIDLTLSKKLTGDEAKAFVNRLHFNSVTNEKNEIGFYGEGSGGAVIYVTFYENESDANINFEKMTNKISPDNSVFINGSFYEIDGVKVYRCFGMGQTHFVFTLNKELFWLSVPTMGNEKYLKAYLNRIQ